MFADETARRLFEHGSRDLAERFDRDLDLVRLAADPSRHDLRDSLWYALCLLLEPDDGTDVAERIIARVLTTQERREDSPHEGNFFWLYEDAMVHDLNAVQFALERIIHILLHSRERLSGHTRDAILGSMRLAFEEVERLDVHWTYTNIYLLDVHNSILGGEILGDANLVLRGLARLRKWTEKTTVDGAPHEFNSPTYSAVQINALAAIAQHARDGDARTLAREMEEFLWRHVAAHWHAPTVQLAGPHSRAYRRDVTGSVGFLKVLLYRLLGDDRLLASTPYFSGPGREGDVIIALTKYHCPWDALEMLRATGEREVRECTSQELGMEFVTYLRPEFAVGTMSRHYAVGDPPEAWPQQNACTVHYTSKEAPGYGVLYCRYVLNERHTRGSAEFWDEGVFRAAQRGPTAMVAYGAPPRGYRPLTEMRLDIRLLSPEQAPEVMTVSGAFTGDQREAPAGSQVVIADGDVYIGIVPLEADRLTPETPGIVLWRDARETVLSIYNYRGPRTAFWEYRALAGPFFKGNVRNGFALTVAPRGEFENVGGFFEHLSSLPLEDSSDGSVRRIRFADVTLEYDLRELGRQ